jgi:carbon storage regulator
MLVLSRKTGESIVLGDGIVVTLVEVRGQRARLGIQAPRDVAIWRQELAEFKTGELELDPVAVEDVLSPYERFVTG